MEQKHDAKLLALIPVPATLNDKQIELATSYARGKLMDGFTISEFCKNQGISTKTWYSYLENDDFKQYLDAVMGSVVPDDERQAFAAMKKHVMKFAYKQNPTPKEIELFYQTFGYIAESDKRDQMEKLGLNEVKTGSDFKTVEERKASLLSRLRNN
ncbi:phBC6A51 family helix-turn-helix protein [Planococcus sp. 1R117A]|uniref:phBC6A51 family helix-turn-helix protein n=1 Tax=Planococcus sp. 1R117A TaxID=3447020 RepID=UPI003EDC7865